MYKIQETKLEENLRKKAKISRFIRTFYRYIPKQTLETYRKELDLMSLYLRTILRHSHRY